MGGPIASASAAGDAADDEAEAESTDDATGGMLADVVFGRDVDLLGLRPGFAPLLVRGSADLLGLFPGHVLERLGLFGGGALEGDGLLAGDIAEVLHLFALA